MKEGDLILVSAEATGLGKPMGNIHGTNPCNGHLYATRRLIWLRWLFCRCTYNKKTIIYFLQNMYITKYILYIFAHKLLICKKKQIYKHQL